MSHIGERFILKIQELENGEVKIEGVFHPPIDVSNLTRVSALGLKIYKFIEDQTKEQQIPGTNRVQFVKRGEA